MVATFLDPFQNNATTTLALHGSTLATSLKQKEDMESLTKIFSVYSKDFMQVFILFFMPADSAILPNGDLWVTGGYRYRFLSSTDIIDKDFNIKRGPDLPVVMSHHCIVNWNDTHMLLTGGNDGYNYRYSF